MRIERVFFLMCVLLFWADSVNSLLFAQSELTRVSIDERSDGAGYVLRNHLTEAPDSIRVARPSPSLFQVNIYGSKLSAGEIPVDVNEEIEDIRLFDIENGIGVDVYLGENRFFDTGAYPDVNNRDLLLALEYTTEEIVLASIAEDAGFDRIVDGSTGADQTGQKNPEEGGEPNIVQAKSGTKPQRAPGYISDKRVTIGVLTGLSASDVKGNAFVSEIRQGISFGLAVGIQFPWELPYKIETGIETGIFYAEKGFKNPSPDFLNAETVEFDYIEVPILAKFSYPLLKRVSPYVLAGPSLGFKVSAERVRLNGTRADLDDQTTGTDLSAIIAGGVDMKLNRQILSLQVKGGLSFFDVFKNVEESPATDIFKHRYIALELILRL